jgi:hypothetical protein
MTILLSCFWLVFVARGLKIKGSALLSKTPSYLVLMIGLALMNLPPFILANSLQTVPDWHFYFTNNSEIYQGGALFLWIAGAGYLATFVTIGRRMGFVIALKYFGIFLAVVVAILYIMAVLDVKLDGLLPSRLKFAGLYVMVTFFGGLMLLTALVSFLYKSYNITKKSLLFFLIITPLLGVMLGTLAAEIGAKVGGWQRGRNNRIATERSLNQHCASAADLASMLRTGTPKIVLQQYRPQPDSCTAAKEAYHYYSISSSARAYSVSGMVRPRALAVLRLMTKSTLVACWTGKSPGLSPFRIRAVYWPTTRHSSAGRAP